MGVNKRENIVKQKLLLTNYYIKDYNFDWCFMGRVFAACSDGW